MVPLYYYLTFWMTMLYCDDSIEGLEDPASIYQTYIVGRTRMGKLTKDGARMTPRTRRHVSSGTYISAIFRQVVILDRLGHFYASLDETPNNVVYAIF